MVQVKQGIRDVKCKCRQCSSLYEVSFYLRLTIKEIRAWREGVSDACTCPAGHKLKFESVLCYFRVDDKGQTIDPTHPDWTNWRNREE
jgi:hypothetical protein